MDGPRQWLSIVGVAMVAGLAVVLWRTRGSGAAERAPGPGRGTRVVRNAGGENWNAYMARVNGRLASVLVDLGRRARAPDSSSPVLLWAHLRMRAPRPDGLPSSEEAPDLLRVSQALEEAAKDAAAAEVVGTITSGGVREFYFYGPGAAGFERAIADALRSFPGYVAETGSKPDPGWSHYLEVLYPRPADLQRMKNRALHEALRAQGDDPSARRVVSHWVYFETRGARDAFVARATASGFREPPGARSEPEGRFGIRLEHESTTDESTMEVHTLRLEEWARELGGEYDGWETPIQRKR
jgi:hypothetical protein